MFKTKVSRLAGLLATLVLGACASTAASGVTSKSEPTYVASVQVNQHDDSVPTGYAAALHEAVVKEAALYGNAGRPISLRIDLDKVHFKNPVAAMLIGDDNRAEGRVAVVDPSAGELGTFPIVVNAETSGISGVDIGMTVVGALDPTGAVAIATMAGEASSAILDPSGTAAVMNANFAAEALRQTYGDERAKAANAVRKAQAHARKQAESNAPK